MRLNFYYCDQRVMTRQYKMNKLVINQNIKDFLTFLCHELYLTEYFEIRLKKFLCTGVHDYNDGNNFNNNMIKLKLHIKNIL